MKVCRDPLLKDVIILVVTLAGRGGHIQDLQTTSLLKVVCQGKKWRPGLCTKKQKPKVGSISKNSNL